MQGIGCVSGLDLLEPRCTKGETTRLLNRRYIHQRKLAYAALMKNSHRSDDLPSVKNIFGGLRKRSC